jgi:hypothetical protein
VVLRGENNALEGVWLQNMGGELLQNGGMMSGRLVRFRLGLSLPARAAGRRERRWHIVETLAGLRLKLWTLNATPDV